MIQDTLEYQLIEEFYGDSVAKRSRVPMINHINEGLIVLDEINATEFAKRAFCVHPMVQADLDLANNYDILIGCDPHVIALAMEYRSVANEYLSDKVGNVLEIRLSPLAEVNQMLIADKVQNCKDFMTYHKRTHVRAAELTQYFINWMERLEIDEELYYRLCAAIDAAKETTVPENEELAEKVKVYEGLMHRIQMLSIAGNHENMRETIEAICNWSYAHRSGNGELSEEEEAERVRVQYEKLKEIVGYS